MQNDSLDVLKLDVQEFWLKIQIYKKIFFASCRIAVFKDTHSEAIFLLRQF